MYIAFRNSYVFMYEVTVMSFKYAIPAFTHYYYHLVCLFFDGHIFVTVTIYRFFSSWGSCVMTKLD